MKLANYISGRVVVATIVVILSLLIGALYLNSAAYHLWLTDGPPVENREIHFNLFIRHISIFLVCLFIVGAGIAFLVKSKK